MICKECSLEMELYHKTKDSSCEYWVCSSTHFFKIIDSAYQKRAEQIRQLLWTFWITNVSSSILEYWLTELRPDWRNYSVEQLSQEFKEFWNSPGLKQMMAVPFGWALDPKELERIAPMENFR